MVIEVYSLPASPKSRSPLMNYVLTSEIWLETSEHSLSSIMNVNGCDVSEREKSYVKTTVVRIGGDLGNW